MNTPTHLLRASAFIVGGLLSAVLLHGQSTWTGNTDFRWSISGNWDPNSSPSSGSVILNGGTRLRTDLQTGTSFTLNSLTVGGANSLVWLQSTSSQRLTVDTTLSNSGLILVRHGGDSNATGGRENALIYTGSAFANTGTIAVINDNQTAAVKNNPDARFSIQVGNTNAGTLTVLNSATVRGTENGAGDAFADLRFEGTGTFTNTGAVNVARTATVAGTPARVTGANATYAQTSATAVTRVGEGASLVTHTVTIADGSLIGSGTVTGSVGGVTIGNDNATAAHLRANAVSVGSFTVNTAPDITTAAPGIATLTFGSTLNLRSDAVFTADIDTALGASDRLVVEGDFNLFASGGNNAVLVLNDIGGDASLAIGTALTLVDYSGTWNGGLFRLGSVSGTLLEEGTLFNLGSNAFTIHYAGDGVLGTATGGTDVVLLAAIPEPSSYAGLIGIAALAAVAFARRRR